MRHQGNGLFVRLVCCPINVLLCLFRCVFIPELIKEQFCKKISGSQSINVVLKAALLTTSFKYLIVNPPLYKYCNAFLVKVCRVFVLIILRKKVLKTVVVSLMWWQKGLHEQNDGWAPQTYKYLKLCLSKCRKSHCFSAGGIIK